MVSETDQSKGIDLVIDILPELMGLNAQVVILGTGIRSTKRRFGSWGAVFWSHCRPECV